MNKGEKEADSVALWVNFSEGFGCEGEFIASTKYILHVIAMSFIYALVTV